MDNELIYKQDAIEALGEEPEVWENECYEIAERAQWRRDVAAIKAVDSAQSNTGFINILCRKTPEEQYNFINWLLNDYGNRFTDTRQAVIDWLDSIKEYPSSAKSNAEKHKQITNKSELVDKQEVLKLPRIGCRTIGLEEYVKVSDIENMPTIKSEHKKGWWIPQDNNEHSGMASTCVYYFPKCSNCGVSANYTNFCPNCGADMREGGK